MIAPASLEDRFAGCLLGLALGDACGAPYEGGPLERALWALLRLWTRQPLRWTDDTQMALGLAESLLEGQGFDPGRAAARWAREARWSRGYGSGTWRILSRIRQGEDRRAASKAVFPEGSFGNGAAMRAAPLGLYFHRMPDELARAAAEASAITHAHPLGVEGGVLMARAAALALADFFEPYGFLAALAEGCREAEFLRRLAWARAALERASGPREVREALGSGVKAQESVVTALYCFCRFSGDFDGMLAFIRSLKGDVDTIGAMAGALFGAKNGLGALPAPLLGKLEERARIEGVGRALYAARR